MWKAYLLRKNIERYVALLDDPGTPEETRRVAAELLVEARAELSALVDDPRPRQEDRRR